jgi:hypothetical protein
MTANQAIETIRTHTDGVLLWYATSITTQFGSYNLGIYYASRSSPVMSPTKDYWVVTLSGLNKDSNGNDLLPESRPDQPPHHTISFVIDDSTGQYVQSTEAP